MINNISEKIKLKCEIIENITTGVLVLDGQKIIYANPWILNKIGYTEDEIYSAESFVQFTMPEYVDMIVDYNKRRTAGDTNLPTQYEIKVMSKYKEIMWFDCNVSTFKGENEKIKVLFFMKDITEFKKTDENYTAIFEISPDAILLAEKNTGEIVKINRAFTEIMQYNMDDLKSLSLYDIIVNPDKDKIIECIQNNVVRQKRMMMKIKDNSTIHVSLSVSPLTIQTNNYIIAIIRDVTELVNQEEKMIKTMTKNKALYSSLMSLLDNISYFVWIRDLSGNILFANKPLRNLFGIKEDFINVNGTDLTPLFQFGNSCIENNQEVMKSKKEGVFTENVIINNEKHIFNTTKTPIFDKDKNVIGVSCIAAELVDTTYIEDRLQSFKKYSEEKNQIISNIINSIKIKKEK